MTVALEKKTEYPERSVQDLSIREIKALALLVKWEARDLFYVRFQPNSPDSTALNLELYPCILESRPCAPLWIRPRVLRIVVRLAVEYTVDGWQGSEKDGHLDAALSKKGK